MAVDVPTFPTGNFDIDLGSSNETAFTVLENVFGDGYIQRAADGLNSNRDSWSASWTNLTDAESQIIYGFLRERSGYKPFYYQAPGDSEIKQWTARDVRRQPMGVSNDLAYWKISCTLKQEFGSTIEVKVPAMLEGVVGRTGVGVLAGNAPTFLLTGIEGTGEVGLMWPSNFILTGVQGTGSAGSMSPGILRLTGVGGEAVAGTITPNIV